jgi:hypothetical protein
MAEELSKLAERDASGFTAASRRITLGTARESIYGKIVPVLLDGTPFTIYLPLMRAPQSIKRWDKKSDNRGKDYCKYELPLLPETSMYPFFTALDDAIAEQVTSRCKQLELKFKPEEIKFRCEKTVKEQKDPSFAPTVRVKVPHSARVFMPTFLSENGNKLDVSTDNYLELIPYHSRVRTACHASVFINTTAIYLTLTLHVARVHPVDGYVVTQDQIDRLNADLPVESRSKRSAEELTDDDIEALNADLEVVKKARA